MLSGFDGLGCIDGFPGVERHIVIGFEAISLKRDIFIGCDFHIDRMQVFRFLRDILPADIELRPGADGIVQREIFLRLDPNGLIRRKIALDKKCPIRTETDILKRFSFHTGNGDVQNSARCLSARCIRHAVDGDIFGRFHRDETLARRAVAYADALHLRLAVFIIFNRAVFVIGNGADTALTGNERDVAAVVFDLDASERVSAAGIFIGHDNVLRRRKHDVAAGGNRFHREIMIPDIIDINADADGAEIPIRRQVGRDGFFGRPDGSVRAGSNVQTLCHNGRRIGSAVVNISETRDRYIAFRLDGRNRKIFIRFDVAFFRAPLDIDMTFALVDGAILDFPNREFAFGRIRLDTDRQFFFDDEIFAAVLFVLDGDGRSVRFGHRLQVFETLARISEILGIDRRLLITVEPRIVSHIDGDVVSFDIRCFIGRGRERVGRRIHDAVFDRIQQRFFVPRGIILYFFFALFFGLRIVGIDGLLFLFDHRCAGVAAAQETHRAPFFEKRAFIGRLERAVREGIDDAAARDIERHIAAGRVNGPDAHIARLLRERDILGRLRIDTRGERIAVNRHLPRIHSGRDAAVCARQIDALGGNGRAVGRDNISFFPLRHELERIRFLLARAGISRAGQIHIALRTGSGSGDSHGNILAI